MGTVDEYLVGDRGGFISKENICVQVVLDPHRYSCIVP